MNRELLDEVKNELELHKVSMSIYIDGGFHSNGLVSTVGSALDSIQATTQQIAIKNRNTTPVITGLRAVILPKDNTIILNTPNASVIRELEKRVEDYKVCGSELFNVIKDLKYKSKEWISANSRQVVEMEGLI